MKYREGKIPVPSLVTVSVITVFLMLIEFNSLSEVKAEYYEEKMAAAELTSQSYEAIKEAMNTLEIPINSTFDPNETGLIGIPYSNITTGRGDLNAKLTSINPNFAALIVKLIREAGLNKNDRVAVSFTGSFPAVNIAVLSAIKVLELDPIIITSVGSTMWGANHPQFTYLDMEHILHQKGLHAFRTAAASISIEDDISSEGRKMIEESATRNNVSLLKSMRLDEAVRKRTGIYTSGEEIRLFINVSDGTTPLGNRYVGPGFVKPRERKEERAIVVCFSNLGVPVIDLVDILHLARKNHLPIAPSPLPDIGEGDLYHTPRYSVKLALLNIAILLIVLFVAFKLDINYYIKNIFTRIH